MLERLSLSTTPLISLEAFKIHLRIDHDGEDIHLQDLIKTATEWVEQDLGRSLLTQVWQKTHYPPETYLATTLECSSMTTIELNYPPVIEVISIALMTDPPKPIKRYVLNKKYLTPRLSVGFCTAPVTVVYRCGYAEVPLPLKQAVMHVATSLYLQRETGFKDTLLVNLLNPFRIPRVT